jgi:hypothetical protein
MAVRVRSLKSPDFLQRCIRDREPTPEHFKGRPSRLLAHRHFLHPRRPHHRHARPVQRSRLAQRYGHRHSVTLRHRNQPRRHPHAALHHQRSHLHQRVLCWQLVLVLLLPYLIWPGHPRASASHLHVLHEERSPDCFRVILRGPFCCCEVERLHEAPTHTCLHIQCCFSLFSFMNISSGGAKVFKCAFILHISVSNGHVAQPLVLILQLVR